MNLIIIAVVVVLLSGLIYIIIAPKDALQAVYNGPFNLQSSGGTPVVKTSDLGSTPFAFLQAGEGAFQCFVYLDGNIRTGTGANCGTDVSQPSCGTGLYQPCPCSTIDCIECVHTGYKNLVNIYNTYRIEVLTAPDASRQNSVSAQITVKTAPSYGNYAIETFPLPPLPEQKWTMITISKQGRQIFVYYNSTLVLSKKALNTFSTAQPHTANPAAVVGDINLSGNLAMATFFPKHQAIPDVTSRYQSMVDTRGNLITMPVTPTSSSYSIQSKPNGLISQLCLDGSCFNTTKPPTIVPTIPSIYNPLQTSYA